MAVPASQARRGRPSCAAHVAHSRRSTRPLEREYLNLIGGQWTPAAAGATQPDRNPARTGEVVAVFPSAGREDATRAAEAAAKAFPGWARTPMPKRGLSA
jgi:delta 1-pyrroline-5-carboxylate dehydrogenase